MSTIASNPFMKSFTPETAGSVARAPVAETAGSIARAPGAETAGSVGFNFGSSPGVGLSCSGGEGGGGFCAVG